MELKEPSAKYSVPQFKRTEAGEIPMDWLEMPIGEMGEVTSGGTPSRKVPAFWGGDIPWVTTAELDRGEVMGASQFITTAGLQNSAAKWLPVGTLLIALYGQGKTRGKCAVLRIAATTNQACAAIRLAEEVDSGFVRHSLTHRYEYIRGLSNGGGQENLSGAIVKQIRVGMPPTRAEQKAIASALSDADALIDSLEQMLTKKRQIKQGAMQELLTGQRRLLPGAEAWREVPFGSLGRWTGGMTPSMARPDYWSPAEVPWLSSGDLKGARLSESTKYISELAVSDGATTVVPAKSVIVVMRSGILRKHLPVGITLKAMAINQDLKAVLPRDDVAPEFLLHALTFWGERILATCLKSGTTVESIEFRWLKAFTIDLPTLPEQEVIAGVLSDMDAEISALEVRLTKARALKQAMAQALLTGRVRLPIGPQEPAAPVSSPVGVSARVNDPARTQEHYA